MLPGCLANNFLLYDSVTTRNTYFEVCDLNPIWSTLQVERGSMRGYDYKLRTEKKLEMKMVGETALFQLKCRRSVDVGMLGISSRRIKFFWKWGPRTAMLSNSLAQQKKKKKSSRSTGNGLNYFFFLRRKQRCLRYGPPTLAGGSDKTSSLGCPTHAALPAEYKDTPLGSCWVLMRKDQCCVATSTYILAEFQEMVWLTCQVIQI